jgi:beta-1,4-mannosyltransferase
MLGRLEAWLDVLRLAKRIGYFIVWTAHNLYPHDAPERKLHHFARIELLKLCDALVVHTDSGRKQLAEAFGRLPERTVVIPHGHYIDGYEPPPPKGTARQRLGIRHDEFLFLCFGYLRPYKGIERVIAEMISRPIQRARLLIAGQPWVTSYGRFLLDLAHNSPAVDVHPFYIPEDEVPLYFGSADAVVLPYSEVFTSGVAVLAHSFGKPVIGPRLGCLDQMVPEETGWLYDPADYRALSGALRAAVTCDGDVVRERCLAFARSRSWRSIAAATKALYLSISDPV